MVNLLCFVYMQMPFTLHELLHLFFGCEARFNPTRSTYCNIFWETTQRKRSSVLNYVTNYIIYNVLDDDELEQNNPYGYSYGKLWGFFCCCWLFRSRFISVSFPCQLSSWLYSETTQCWPLRKGIFKPFRRAGLFLQLQWNCNQQKAKLFTEIQLK